MTGRPRRGSVCLFFRPTLPARAMMTARMFGVSRDSIYWPLSDGLGVKRYQLDYPVYLNVTENPTSIATLWNVAWWSMQGLHTGCGVVCARPGMLEVGLV